MRVLCLLCRAALLLLAAAPVGAAELLVEAEGFSQHGGWVLDPQFVDAMGSPYLLAHGLGKSVADATTTVEFPQAGEYCVWVRTKDWVPSQHPGRFRVLVDGVALRGDFGDRGRGWLWQDGGAVRIVRRRVAIALHDLTGFDGRCDAIYFTTDPQAVPPNAIDANSAAWRRRLLGLPETPPSAGKFDVVIVGGGLAGCSAALAAARLGLDVALVQNRPVLGGNASAEIGITPRGQNRSVVAEVAGRDREKALRGEKTLRVFLGWHAFCVTKRGEEIASVDAKNTTTNQELRFSAPLFVDCTGTGAVGYLAGADFRLGREARAEFNESLAPEVADKMHHGNTVVFATRQADRPASYPPVPWATAVAGDYADLGGQVTEEHDNHEGLTHFWEYGQRSDPVADAEAIRDHLFCAVYGTFANAKRLHPEKNARLELARVGHVPAGGESRRLMGDYILNENDVRAGRVFPDAAALCSGHFCLHYPGDKYDFRLGDWKFIPVPVYSVPLRCLYSRNVDNLLMAGKHISVTHVAGSSTKTMLNGGQTGVAVGATAFLCKKHGVAPRQVGQRHIQQLHSILLETGPYRDVFKPRSPRGTSVAVPRG